MANSLRAKLSKLRHDGNITDAEYQAFIKKMDGHDAKIREKAIDEFSERMKDKVSNHFTYRGIIEDSAEYADYVDEIAEQMKEGVE